jgi:hypothetical protein
LDGVFTYLARYFLGYFFIFRMYKIVLTHIMHSNTSATGTIIIIILFSLSVIYVITFDFLSGYSEGDSGEMPGGETDWVLDMVVSEVFLEEGSVVDGVGEGVGVGVGDGSGVGLGAGSGSLGVGSGYGLGSGVGSGSGLGSGLGSDLVSSASAVYVVANISNSETTPSLNPKLESEYLHIKTNLVSCIEISEHGEHFASRIFTG